MKNKTVRTVLSVLGGILCVVFAAMLIGNISIIIQGVLHPETPPSLFGVTPMVVLSGSMSGTADDHIEVGDLIFATKADTSALQVGDIVSFMDGQVVVTHRIVRIDTAADGQRQFITKGDANNAEDPPIAASAVIGRYMTRIPKLGDLAMFLQKPLGMAIFIGVPVCAFILIDILRRKKQSRRESEETARLKAELEALKAAKAADAS